MHYALCIDLRIFEEGAGGADEATEGASDEEGENYKHASYSDNDPRCRLHYKCCEDFIVDPAGSPANKEQRQKHYPQKLAEIVECFDEFWRQFQFLFACLPCKLLKRTERTTPGAMEIGLVEERIYETNDEKDKGHDETEGHSRCS